MKRIQSKKHKIGTYEVHKISLSCFDDKKFVFDDGIHKIASFHKKLKKQILISEKCDKILYRKRTLIAAEINLLFSMVFT